jgi:hypothetical protein
MRISQQIVVVVALAAGSAASAQFVTATNTKPGQFIDISTFGTRLELTDDGVSQPIPYNRPNRVIRSGPMRIGNNGGVGFNVEQFREDSTDLPPDNEALPSAIAYGGGQALLPFWDDPGADVGGVFYTQLADRVVIQWDRNFNAAFRGGTERPNFGSWQLQLIDAGAAVDAPFAQFVYRDIEDSPALGGAIATIGYQDGGVGFNTVQWSFNQAGAVSNGTVLSFELSNIPSPGALGLCAAGLLLGARRRR